MSHNIYYGKLCCPGCFQWQGDRVRRRVGLRLKGQHKKEPVGSPARETYQRLCAGYCGGPFRRARDLPDRDAIACGPALQPKDRMLSRGDASSPFHHPSNIRRGPSDRLSPFPVRAVSLSDVETGWLWSLLTLPSCRRCLWGPAIPGGTVAGVEVAATFQPTCGKKKADWGLSVLQFDTFGRH